MTTAMMVRDWENHCEQTEYSAYEVTKAYDASQDLVIATRKIREALEWMAKAIDSVNEAELTAAEDRITSLYDSVDDLLSSITDEIDNL